MLCAASFAAFCLVFPDAASAEPQAPSAKEKEVATKPTKQEKPKSDVTSGADSKPDAKPEDKPSLPAGEDSPDSDEKAETAETDDSETPAVALPVNPEPVQIYGWYENVFIGDMEEHLLAKLDTGALTSSIHAEKKELFERDGKKWVRFIVANTFRGKVVRARMEAPLVRTARIKEPNAESVAREVVRLSFRIGDRKLRSEFTLNNRSNMVAPVLLGRGTLKDLGWVDPARTFLADQKIMR